MEAEDGTPRASPGSRRRVWLWWLGAWFLWNLVADEIVMAVLDWMVAVGGYGFSNAVLGLLTLGLCFIGIQRAGVRHARIEAEGDPDPLPAPYEYATQAQPGLFLGWAGAVLGWAVPLLWLALAGPAAALTPWPVLGTAGLVYGRMEMAHARAMDARRGRPRSSGGTG